MIKHLLTIILIVHSSLNLKNKLPPLCYIECDHGLVFYNSQVLCSKRCAIANKPLIFNFSAHFDERHIVTKDEDSGFKITLPYSYNNKKLNSAVNHTTSSVNELSVSAYSDSQSNDLVSSNVYGDFSPQTDGTIVMNNYTAIAVNDILRRYLTKTLPTTGSMSLATLSSSNNFRAYKFKLHSAFENLSDDVKTNYFYKLINLEGRYRVYYNLLIHSEHNVEYDFTIDTDANCGIREDEVGLNQDVDEGGFDKYTTTTRLPNKFKLNDELFKKRNLCKNTTGCQNFISLEAGSTFCLLMRNTKYFRDSDAYLVVQFVPEFNIESKEVKKIYYEVSSWFPWTIFFVIVGVVLLLIMVMSLAAK